jgi:hypothetical protein
MAPHRSILAGLVVAATFTGCTIGDDDASSGDPGPSAGSTTRAAPSTDATPAPSTTGPATSSSGPSSTATVTTSTATSTPDTTLPPTTTTTPPATTTTDVTTTSQPATTTTAAGTNGSVGAPADRVSVSADIPSGEFIAAPGDLIVSRTDGDLDYLPNALSPGNQAPAITLLDRTDPRPATSDQPGANVVADVAGFVDGSVIYGECCEPVSGNIFAVAAPGSETGPVAVGNLVDRSPNGSMLAAASYLQLSVFDLESGDGDAIVLQQASGPVTIIDVEWATDDTLLVIVFDGQDHRVLIYDAATLTASPVQLNLDPTVEVQLDAVRFVGRTPDGQVAVATTSGSGSWDVLYLDPDTLDDDDQLRQTFPLSVTNLEIDAGGLGQIWVDGGTLYYLGPGQFEARPIDDDVAAAWFVE